MHQGYRKDPINHNGIDLYFRGSTIVKSHFKYLLEKHNFAHADRVVMTGISAGAIGAFMWSNYAQTIIHDPTALLVISDSGVFLPFNIFGAPFDAAKTSLQALFSVVNVEEKTPLDLCNKAFPGAEWNCLSLLNSYCSISAPILLINSQYDSYVINNTLQIKCVSQAQSGG